MTGKMGSKIVQNFTLLGLLVFLIGYMHSLGFLGYFDVNPLAYLSNTEIIYTLLPIVTLVVYGVGGILSSESRQVTSKKEDEKFEAVELTEKEIVEYLPQKDINKLFVLFASLLSLIFSIFTCEMVFKVKIIPEFISPYYSLVALILILILVGLKFWVKVLFSNELSFSDFFVIIVVCLLLSQQIGNANAKALINSKSSNEFEFVFRGKKIKTNNKFLLIKETQSTLLFFNKTDSSTHIYKRDEVDSLTVKKIKTF